LILQQLIDDHFPRYTYRIQLELLAITTAVFIKHRQYNYESLPNLYKHLLPMLLSDRRELRHGAMECLTVIAAYMNAFNVITETTIENNASIQTLIAYVEQFSLEAAYALRFRLQRNLLATLTDDGNIMPGLTFQTNPTDDPDIRFILLATKNTMYTSGSTHEHELTMLDTLAINGKLLRLPMPLTSTINNNKHEVRTMLCDLIEHL
jgi:hypothetical protein